MLERQRAACRRANECERDETAHQRGVEIRAQASPGVDKECDQRTDAEREMRDPPTGEVTERECTHAFAQRHEQRDRCQTEYGEAADLFPCAVAPQEVERQVRLDARRIVERGGLGEYYADDRREDRQHEQRSPRRYRRHGFAFAAQLGEQRTARTAHARCAGRGT